MLAAGSSDNNKRSMFGMWHGIGLVIMAVSGFGILAKLKLGFPHFAYVKILLWLILGGLPVLAKRRLLPTGALIAIALGVVAVGAWLGFTKPLW